MCISWLLLLLFIFRYAFHGKFAEFSAKIIQLSKNDGKHFRFFFSVSNFFFFLKAFFERLLIKLENFEAWQIWVKDLVENPGYYWNKKCVNYLTAYVCCACESDDFVHCEMGYNNRLRDWNRIEAPQADPGRLYSPLRYLTNVTNRPESSGRDTADLASVYIFLTIINHFYFSRSQISATTVS